MKKLIFIGISIIISGFGFNSCKKEVKESNTVITNGNSMDENLTYIDVKEVRNILSNNHQANKVGGIGEWIKNHTGRYGKNDCGGGGGCGPCPAICFSRGILDSSIDHDGKLSSTEFEEGLRLFLVKIVSGNNEKLIIQFSDQSLQHDGEYLYIDEDVVFEENTPSLFNVNYLKIKKGAYPIVYDFSDQGETVVDVIIE